MLVVFPYYRYPVERASPRERQEREVTHKKKKNGKKKKAKKEGKVEGKLCAICVPAGSIAIAPRFFGACTSGAKAVNPQGFTGLPDRCLDVTNLAGAFRNKAYCVRANPQTRKPANPQTRA